MIGKTISNEAQAAAALNHPSICTICEVGEHKAAIDQIETLLSVPGDMSAGILRIDPIWDPIRSDPRFRRLTEGN